MIDTSQLTKFYYSIGEVSRMFDVNASLIRFWEKEFHSIQPKKNKKGNRLFTKKDIEEINIIYYLVKTKGYTLKGAKEYLSKNKKTTDEKLQTIQSLMKVRQFLIGLRNQL